MDAPTAREIMTPSPIWCLPHDPLEIAARQMAEHDCGALPIVDDAMTRRPMGILTDRDIVTRVIARGLSPVDCTVGEVMTADPFVVHVDATFDDCARAMERHHVRRILVVDDRSKVIGILTDGDLARACCAVPELEHELARVIEEVSGPEPR